MKKMYIQSDSPSEDIMALGIISKDTAKIPLDQVVWKSDMGKKLAEIDTLLEKLFQVETRLSKLEENQFKLRSQIKEGLRELENKKPKIEAKDGKKK